MTQLLLNLTENPEKGDICKYILKKKHRDNETVYFTWVWLINVSGHRAVLFFPKWIRPSYMWTENILLAANLLRPPRSFGAEEVSCLSSICSFL